MEKFYNAVCWIGLGILTIFGLVILVYRLIGVVFIIGWILFGSLAPWWARILALAAITAGMTFIIRRYGTSWGFTGTWKPSRRIPRNTNFAYYTSKTKEERSSTSPKTEDL